MYTNVKRAVLVSVASLAAIGAISSGMLRAQTGSVAATSDATVAQNAVMSTATEPCEYRHQQKTEAFAKLLGITSDQLQTELNSGKPLYQIEAEHGLTYDKLVQQREQDFQAKLNGMVKVGYLTQDEANSFMEQFKQNEQHMPFGFGLGRHGMGWMMSADASSSGEASSARTMPSQST